MKTVLELFLTFFKIGAFSFGGGYVMIPFIQREIVGAHQWLSADEFIDVLAISQVTPGPIATNSSTYVGYKVAGFVGALSGTIGVIGAAFLLALFISKRFEKVKHLPQVKLMFKGLRPAVLGLIFSAGISVGVATVTSYKELAIAVFSFVGIVKFKIHPIVIIAVAGCVGLILF
ncbi:MAG: chromate transporter [Clostridia bacterium]|nr:chromate transporter [Clostridia bacterium]